GTARRFWGPKGPVRRGIDGTGCSPEGTAANSAPPGLDRTAPAATTRAPDGASTSRAPCCRDGRECPAATSSPRRRVALATGPQGRRPFPSLTKVDLGYR